jgi:hypothetical protein
MRHLLLLPIIGLLACSNSDPMDATIVDSGVEEDGSVVDPGGPEWEDSVVVEGLNSQALVGDFAVLRVKADNSPAVAYGYFAVGDIEPHIHYAEKSGATWDIDDVIEIGRNGRMNQFSVPPYGTLDGLGFDFVAGVPHISYYGGAFDGPAPDNPGPNITDLMLSTRAGGNWTERTLVQTSGDVVFDCTGQGITDPYCQFGYVVGQNATLAARPGGGFGVVYRDVHNGFADEDLRSADVEYFGEGGGMGPMMVDAVRSGGRHSALTFDRNGNPVVAFYLALPRVASDTRVGPWIGYIANGVFTQVQVSRADISMRMSLTRGTDGTLYLAYFDGSAWDLVVAESSDDGATWALTKVDESGKTGLHPSLAIDGQGRPVVAYTYCGKTTNRECPGVLGAESEIRLARKEGGVWKKYVADDGQGFGGVGLFNSLAVGSDGKLQLIYQDPVNSDLVYRKEK